MLIATRTVLGTPDIEIFRRSEADDRVDDRKVRRLIAAGTWTRIAPGVLVLATQWVALTPMEQHRVRVLEALRRTRGPVIPSHFAAAALWGIDVLGGWPEVVDVFCSRGTGGRSTGLFRRHGADLESLDLVPIGEHFVTSPAQTALDLARALPFVRGVTAVDQAVWSARPRGPLTTLDELVRLQLGAPRHPRDARAGRAISFANPLAANVRETQSRVVIMQLGFPAPRLQEKRTLRTGRRVLGDFYFEAHDHWAELDGRGKYQSPVFGAGRSAAEIAIDEKNRENEIRREVKGFSRWEPADVDDRRRLYDILTGDGLPSVLPRPASRSRRDARRPRA